jgi:thiol-disulfide isomerase/thioredoxin
MVRGFFPVFVLLLFLSGCTSEAVIEEPTGKGGPVAEPFPSWSSSSHNDEEFNGSMFENEPYVAYFSAPWCAHCEETLDAYDQTLPEGKMMVFSYDGREDYSDMNGWHNKTETNLNRTIDRPFMLNPSLAEEVNLTNIPFVLFVNEQGYVHHIEIGRITDVVAISEIWNGTLSATVDDNGVWN